MKLYLLKRLKPFCNYDENVSLVVRAETVQAARRLAAEVKGDEVASTWLKAEHSTCVELTAAGEEEIIIIRINAG